MTDAFNYLRLARATSKLGAIARFHDTEKFSEAMRALDIAPIMILRGIAFLSDCMENLDPEDLPPRQVAIARATINEITALCAALLDQQCSAEALATLKTGEVKS